MRKLLFSIFFLSLVVSFTACDDDDDVTEIVTLPVNYANVSGEWNLISWHGENLPSDIYFNITFDRRDHVFTIRQNLNSMYEQELTGSYSIELQDDDETYIMSGYYSYGKGSWEHNYIVSEITVDGQMTLVAQDDESEVAILKKTINND